MFSRAAVFMSVLMVSLTQPAFPYVWAAPAETAPHVEAPSIMAARSTNRVKNNDLRFTALQAAVRSRAGDLTSRERTWAENRIEAAGRQVDKKATTDAAGVLSRVAKEFGLDSQELLSEKQELRAWWSEMVIVRTILANVPPGMRAEDLLLLRKKGSSWSEIAHGIGFDLRDFVDAARAECRVAAGLESADGKIEKLERNRALDASIWSSVSWIPDP